eukprot:NODE_408_length_9221_cov_0.216400.p7 type:complete len:159 gc:universal NODE_408_length_9221_cov_0.216400:7662-7186(-)
MIKDESKSRAQCELCHKSFTRRSDLKRHMKIHLDDRQYICKICKKAFIQNNALKVHMRTHTGEKPYSCDTCNKRFSDVSAASRHRKIHVTVFKCHYCCKEVSRQDVLNSHIKHFHPPKPEVQEIEQKIEQINFQEQCFLFPPELSEFDDPLIDNYGQL